MVKKVAVFFLMVFVICIGITAFAEEKSPRIVSERPITQISFSSWIQETFRVSPDNRRVAYVIKVGNKQCVVVDGKEEKQYDGIGANSLIFSPDSKRVAYGARLGNNWFVVVDRKEKKQYDDIAKGTPLFSPDSKRVAYGAREGVTWFVVVDEKEEKQYDDIGQGSPLFSPDSKRVAYGARVGNKWCVVVDRKEEKQYDGIVTKREGSIIFDSAESLHYLALIGNDIYLVEERIK